MITCYKCSGINKPTLAITTQQFAGFNEQGMEMSCNDYGNEWSEEVPICKGKDPGVYPIKDKSKKPANIPQRDTKLKEEINRMKKLMN